MGYMVDKQPTEYKGEATVWQALSKNLHESVRVYNNREVNGREFDFCLFMEDVGISIIEVKGWSRSHIVEVRGVDDIILTDNSDPARSPKKQANMYRFALMNVLKERYQVSPLIIPMVCYPFLSEKDYRDKRLDIVSEREFTILKEDLESMTGLASKINEAYSKLKSVPHEKLSSYIFEKIRYHFEPEDVSLKKLELESQDREAYSLLRVYGDKISRNQIDELLLDYLNGTKIICFVIDQDDLDKIRSRLKETLLDKGIEILNGEISLLNNAAKENLIGQGSSIRIFNLEAYVIDNSSFGDIEIVEGIIKGDEERDKLRQLSKVSAFNLDQYMIEHSDTEKNILVEAGAGTGKTHSMISRISYLCNRRRDSLVSLSNSIGMVTFTNEAADNMKERLKLLFMNYYVLTKKQRFLQLIEEVDFMQISTIHKFTTSIIQSASVSLGLGNEFKISSSRHLKEQVYEKNLDTYISSKIEENENFLQELAMPIYELKRKLMMIPSQLYNKSIDISSINISELDESPEEIPYFSEAIQEVVIKSEKEYEEKLIESNKVDLSKYMILLRKVVKGPFRDKCNLSYQYMFIDEFQDSDDSQIDSFVELQKLIGFKLFVVGDLKQSIYRFRGATEKAFDRLDIDEDEWNSYRLNINYRTDSRLLEEYDSIFRKMGEKDRIPFTPGKDTLSSSVNSGLAKEELLRCIEYDDDDESFYDKLFQEIEHQIEVIEELSHEKTLSKSEKLVAILVRENWQIRNILAEAKKRNMNIQTSVGGELYKLKSTLDFYKLALALNNSKEPVYLYNLISSNNVNVDFNPQILYQKSKETKLEILTEILDQYYGKKLGLSWQELIGEVQLNPVLSVLRRINNACKPWRKYNDDIGAQRFYRANYELVLEKLVERYNTDYLSLNRLCNFLKISIVTGQEETARELDLDEDGPTVTCITIHKSKGLEYGSVILPYMNHAIDKSKSVDLEAIYSDKKLRYSVKLKKKRYKSPSYNDIEESMHREKEESRVLYVAMTRAIRNLVWFKNNGESSKGVSWRTIMEEQ